MKGKGRVRRKNWGRKARYIVYRLDPNDESGYIVVKVKHMDKADGGISDNEY